MNRNLKPNMYNNFSMDFSSKVDVFIGYNILMQVEQILSPFFNHKVILVTDDIVYNIFRKTIIKNFTSVFSDLNIYIIPAGENSKSFEEYHKLLHYLDSLSFKKKDTILSFGGGVVSDLSGFVAATYMRGINLINIPTTLIGALDASIGGKNGINFNYKKNIIGTIWQPKLIICDTKILEDLNDNEFNNGISEVLKYGVLKSNRVYEILKNNSVKEHFSELVELSFLVKKFYVQEDEYDSGLRQHLNLGHTIGHAYEKATNHKIKHGLAIATGMILETLLGEKLGYCKIGMAINLANILKRYYPNLSLRCSLDAILKEIVYDKKNYTNRIVFVFAENIGRCNLYELDYNEVLSNFKKINYEEYLV